MPTRTTRELLREVIAKLPPDASVEDAMERLYLLAKIERGIEQADSGSMMSHEEVRRRLGKTGG
ncbi:MAG: hypothetical protein R6W82_03795 [bacterium]